MDKKMKKLAFAALAGMSALAVSSAARAALTTSVVVTPASAAGGYNNDAYELVSFYLTGLSGIDTAAGTLGSGGALLGLSADISDSSANGLFVPGSTASSGTGSWTTYITNGGEGSALAIGSGTTDSSFVNLDTALTPAYDGTNGSATVTGTGSKAKVTAISGNATNFNASWGAVTGAAIVPGAVGGSANNLIAQVYALSGTTVSLNGFYTTYGTNGGPISLTSGAVTPPSTHPIISLTSGSTPVAGYGPADGTLVLTGQGYGSYNPSVATSFLTATTGSVAVSGFNPSTDTEIYALKLDSNGVPLTSAQINTVIADINGTNGLTNASTGVVASTITGVYANLFPSSAGYDVLLTATGVANPAELGFDFSSTGEQDTAVPGITVVGVAAVPEPATAASIVLGASGLLLGRRRNKAIIA